MARDRLSDVMQTYPFWVFDAGVLGGNILFPVFDPALAFSACTAPEINVETREIQPGNWQYKRRVIKHSDVGSITLSRGTRFYDSDFYNWITSAVAGGDTIRRTLFLIHFLGVRSGGTAQVVAGAALGAIGGLATGGVSGVAAGAAGGAVLGAFIDNRIPGRAWSLHDCLPIRYKAGSDFDASSGQVSVAELEVQPEYITEITVATKSPALVRGIDVVSSLT